MNGCRSWETSGDLSEYLSVRSWGMTSLSCHLHGVPAMAASMRLRVGLGGADMECSGLSSCSGSLVFECLMAFGGPLAASTVLAAGGWYGETSASGENIRAFRAWCQISTTTTPWYI